MEQVFQTRITKQDSYATVWKQCTWCRHNLPRTSKFFHKTKATKDGYNTRCKVCIKTLNRVRIPAKEMPRMTKEEHERIDKLQEMSMLKGRIKIAAAKAEFATDGIVLDGRKLTIPIKVCSGCFVQYPATTDYFCRRKQSKKDGLAGQCKKCVNKPKRKRRGANNRRADYN